MKSSEWKDTTIPLRRLKYINTIIFGSLFLYAIYLLYLLIIKQEPIEDIFYIIFLALCAILAIYGLNRWVNKNIKMDSGYEYNIFTIKTLLNYKDNQINSLLRNIEEQLSTNEFKFNNMEVSSGRYYVNYEYLIKAYSIGPGLINLKIRSNRTNSIKKIKVLVGPITNKNNEIANKLESIIDEALRSEPASSR